MKVASSTNRNLNAAMKDYNTEGILMLTVHLQSASTFEECPEVLSQLAHHGKLAHDTCQMTYRGQSLCLLEQGCYSLSIGLLF